MVFSSLPEELSNMRASLPYDLRRSKKSTHGLTGILTLRVAMRWSGMGWDPVESLPWRYVLSTSREEKAGLGDNELVAFDRQVRGPFPSHRL